MLDVIRVMELVVNLKWEKKRVLLVLELDVIKVLICGLNLVDLVMVAEGYHIVEEVTDHVVIAMDQVSHNINFTIINSRKKLKKKD
ncbi:putative ORFan [Cotonvirus japonicus]|uniref:ORFan n=1 Tax=Cotonvirus japonicus TaxID=2811091 RepID=A0ABM7NUA5_9VIRU|nr:putative ORFan [Cotonvirus japonicus]BCS83686.1 putative ORFan [Cotonvirus japonicus]